MSWLEDAKTKLDDEQSEQKKKSKPKSRKKVTKLPEYFSGHTEPKKTTGDLYTEFTAVLMDAGYILTDGLQETQSEEPVRCDMADGKAGTKPGWYYFRVIGTAAFATYGDWRYGGHSNWASYANKQPTQKEVAYINETIAEQAELARKKRDELADLAKRYVQTKINTLPRLIEHDYFASKHISTIIPQAHIFQLGNKSFNQSDYLAVIPLYNPKGEVVNWQTINGQGEKRFRKYAKKKGHFHIIGDIRGASNVIYTEGFATGASIYLSLDCAVVVCFDAGNILPVMDETQELVQGKSIFIGADNDTSETGLKKAEEARDKFPHVKIAMPVVVGTDFNDVWCEHKGDGNAVERITEQFTKAGYEKPTHEVAKIWDGDEATTQIPELITKAPTPKLQGMMDWMLSTAPKASEQSGLLGSIVFACGVSGRLYRENEYGNYSPIQACLVAPSGAGKDFIKKCINKVLNKSDKLQDLIGASSYTSGAAIRNSLIQNPVKISVLDEFGDKLTSALKGNGRDNEAFECFKEVYSDVRGEWIGRSYAMLDPTNAGKKDLRAETIMNPALTILGLSTPQQFVGAITESHVEGGFLNRFIIVDTTTLPVKRKRRVNLEVPDWIVEHCELVANQGRQGNAMPGMGNLADFSKTYSQEAQPREVVLPQEVSDMLWEFSLFLDEQHMGDTLMENISTRWAENARRMAVGIAAFEDPINPRITLELINWCITYVQYHGKKLASLIDRHAHHDEYHKLRNECLDAIRLAKDKGISKSDMNKIKPFRGLKLATRDRLLNELQQMGLVGINLLGVETGGKVVYYATKPNA